MMRNHHRIELGLLSRTRYESFMPFQRVIDPVSSDSEIARVSRTDAEANIWYITCGATTSTPEYTYTIYTSFPFVAIADLLPGF